MRHINKIILHCSASDQVEHDSEQAIRFLHTLPSYIKMDWGKYKNVPCRGWSDIGYHLIITKSGRAMQGRSVLNPGYHCIGQNKNSIGICLTGDQEFTGPQFDTLCRAVHAYCQTFNLDPLTDVYPHAHFNKLKTCPNFDWVDVWDKYKENIYDESR